MSWEVDGPRPDMPGMVMGQMPTGVLGIEPRARGKSGEILWSMVGGGGFNGTRYQGQTFWMEEPASVEFRALIVTNPEDVAAEPFEIAFTLPPEFVGK